MQPRKARRIFRHKVPNLIQPGQKFDSFQHETPTFFSKVSNTLKLLQQPIIHKNNNSANLTQAGFRLVRKQTMTLRMKQLAKPKMKQRSMSLPQRNQIFPKQRQQHNLSQNKQRYSVIEHRDPRLRTKQIKLDQIVGSGLAALPLQKILAQREEYMKVRQHTINIESQQDQQNIHNENKNINEDLKPDREDFMKWLEKIIGNQGNLYEQYEKGLLERVSFYQRKKNKHKLQFQGSWK